MPSGPKQNEDETELHMRQVLEYEGFQVVRIPSSPTKKAADFRVSDQEHKYLIEVKRKEDDPERLARFEQDFLDKGEAIRREAGGHTNTMAGIIRDAAKQLESTPTVPGEFKLIWFAAWGESPQLQMDQFRSTLYGEVDVVTARAQEGRRTIPCYYYTFNEFYNLRRIIDGAIASSQTRSGLYINSLSQNADALKKTSNRSPRKNWRS